MQRSLAALARMHLPWVALLALGAGVAWFWLHLQDGLLANLNGLSMMTGLETLSAADPGEGGGLGPAAACGEDNRLPCVGQPSTPAAQAPR